MELAKIVSESITGEMSKIIFIRGRYYSVQPPTPYVLGRMLKHLSRLRADGGDTRESLIASNAVQYRHMDAAIATAIMGDCPMTPLNRLRKRLYCRRFRRAGDGERLEAFKEILSITIPDAFFVYARLAAGLSDRVARQSAG